MVKAIVWSVNQRISKSIVENSATNRLSGIGLKTDEALSFSRDFVEFQRFFWNVHVSPTAVILKAAA